MSIPFRLISVTILLICTVTSVFAADGCYITTGVPEPRIYYVPTTGTTQPRRFFSGDYHHPVNCPPGSNSSSYHAVDDGPQMPPVSPNRCYANYVGTGGGLEHSGNYTLNGTPINFRLQQCPIDDYIPLLLVGLAGVGFVMVRREILV